MEADDVIEAVKTALINDSEFRKALVKAISNDMECLGILTGGVLATVYQEVGSSFVKKAVLVGGAVLSALFAWSAAKGYITLKLGGLILGWRMKKEKKTHDFK